MLTLILIYNPIQIRPSTIVRHDARSSATASISAKLIPLQSVRRENSGMNSPPCMYAINVLLRSLSFSIRRTCPRKRSRRLRTASSRLNTGFVAVSFQCSPVMICRQRLLNPFIFLHTAGVRSQDSHAWVNVEHTADA